MTLHFASSAFLPSLSLLALMSGMGAISRTEQRRSGAQAATPRRRPAGPPGAKSAGLRPRIRNRKQQDKRVFGVFPNYRTTDGNVPFQPITSKQKLIIGLKDSFDWPVYPVGGAFAALYQLENQNPSFGQGMKGYARRYGTALADQVIGNMMTESIMPSPAAPGSAIFPDRQSAAAAASCTGRDTRCRVFSSAAPIAAGEQFNFSEWLGNGAAVAISNAYYPDTRTASDNIETAGDCLRHGRILAGDEGILAGCEALLSSTGTSPISNRC